MASQEAEPAAPTAPSPTPATADHHPSSTTSPPVEMDALPAHEQDKAPETQHTEQSAATTSSSPPAPQPSHPDSTHPDTAATPAPTTNPPPSEPSQDRPTHTRKPSEALGPATETPITSPPTNTSTGPVLLITLMLTTGQRHPYKIDEKYLANRNTTTTKTGEDFDPLSLSGYKLKELIWTDWRNEWEPRPAAPGSIRLIIYGKMVEDKKSLSDYNFNLATNNILHMTVKPADFGDDDDAAGSAKQNTKSSGLVGRRHRRRQQQGDAAATGGDEGEDGGGGAGCRCVVL
ncbi:hypothetical protein KC332_g12047 [Hortaea werneckii]|uniref:UBL3-like ubiquitin domain-containing protein n=1 Tax=Hortaea werneckii TaxID=91943 RepID=A0A3M7I163_HORWE|nr:hypothetical protein KC358_g12036 [Hortaea werneckii]KAI6816112.1 hypothetical protein KC350_g10850 [Hortaea werneckii]KAI6916259.1 hypothetical protein KC348_g11651 [Hortaea werneckii]KAI6928123.1 hypothetical protein KC341_g11728 [Hortaea werneckii]KAI6962093.1 hypothetical protein KC321_g11952 [Hortaea werneckii]